MSGGDVLAHCRGEVGVGVGAVLLGVMERSSLESISIGNSHTHTHAPFSTSAPLTTRPYFLSWDVFRVTLCPGHRGSQSGCGLNVRLVTWTGECCGLGQWDCLWNLKKKKRQHFLLM